MNETNDQLLAKLMEIEEIEESGGWDQLPSVLFFSDNNGELVPEALTVIDAPSYPNLQTAFYQIAVDPPRPEFTPVAVAMCTECWGPGLPEGLTSADQKAFFATYPYERFADDPNRRELRVVVALTTDGHRYQVTRERGKDETRSSISTQDEMDQRCSLLGVVDTSAGPLRMLLNVWTGGAS